MRKEKRANGKEYYKLYEVKRVNGKVKTKYVSYLGKSPKSTNEITGREMLSHVKKLLSRRLSQEEINDILKKIGIEYDTWPITKIIIEHDLKLEKLFLKIK